MTGTQTTGLLIPTEEVKVIYVKKFPKVDTLTEVMINRNLSMVDEIASKIVHN